MESAALEIGRLYAYRENRRAKSEMLKVKLIAKVGRGGKVKVRFEDGPHPGLEEYVRTANLIVSWGDRKAVLRDEERSQRIDDYSQRSRSDHAIVEAVSSILPPRGSRVRAQPSVGSRCPSPSSNASCVAQVSTASRNRRRYRRLQQAALRTRSTCTPRDRDEFDPREHLGDRPLLVMGRDQERDAHRPLILVGLVPAILRSAAESGLHR
jgi:hypothetical protein